MEDSRKQPFHELGHEPDMQLLQTHIHTPRPCEATNPPEGASKGALLKARQKGYRNGSLPARVSKNARPRSYRRIPNEGWRRGHNTSLKTEE